MRIHRFLHAGRRAAAALALAAVTVLAAGCGTKSVTTPKLPPLSRVTVTPLLDTLTVGGQRLFVAVAYDTSGAAVSGVGFSWRSTVTGVCTVSSAGLATGTGEGWALVIASAGGKADSALVYVRGTTAGWATQTSNTTQNLNGVFFQADGRTGFAVGDAGTMVTTTNAGVTWSTAVSGTGNDLEAVWFTGASAGWAVGKGGTIMHTTNGGGTWTRLTNVGTVNNLFAVRFADANHGWAVGSGGTIAVTADGGNSWALHFPTIQQLNGVAFADTLNGWACGAAGVIVGTHDGGRSWYVVQPSLTAATFKAIARIGNAHAWAVGANGAVAVASPTADSLSWALGSAGSSNQLNGLAMLDTQIGFAVGANPAGLVLATTDGGSSWTPQTANSTEPLTAVVFVDPLRGWAVGGNGRIVHTSNGGAP